MSRALHASVLGIVMTAVPVVAHACPACAANPVDTPGVLAALGGFLLVPFVIAGIVVVTVRRYLA